MNFISEFVSITGKRDLNVPKMCILREKEVIYLGIIHLPLINKHLVTSLEIYGSSKHHPLQ